MAAVTVAAPDAASGAAPGATPEPAWLRWRAVYAYWWSFFRTTWRGSIGSRVLEPVFYLAAMGVGLGSLVNHRHAGQLGGLSYLEFVGPGLVAAAAMQTAAFEATWPVLGSIKWYRSYEAMLAGPLRVGDIVIGQVAWISSVMGLTTGLYLAAVAAFGAIHSPWAILAWPAAVLGGFAFATPVLAFAATAQTDSSFSVLYRFVVVPLFLFSGTFFPISQLPRWMQFVAYATPLWHGVSLTRDLALGHLVPDDLVHVAYLVVVAGVGLAVAQRTFTRRLVT
jgi:lipooligosaccharide transport system permease protein